MGAFPLKSWPEIITAQKQHNIHILTTIQRKIDTYEGVRRAV